MLITAGDTAMPLESRYVGLHLARHQLAGVVIGMLSGNSLPQAIASVERASPLPGTQVRLVTPQEISVVVDRAATPERAHTVLQAMRSETTGRLWCIAGCPDQPAMASSFGHHLERLSHHPILTAQMGRKRDFLRDAHHVLDGVRKPGAMRLLPERPAAIAWALLKARPGDAVLILADPPTGNSAAEKHRCWNQAVAQVEELIAAHSADQTAAL
jgi:UDP-N-acetylmuramoyl-L-alanyl-D-glutamate--2,6-diaminopimelate ligase